MSGSEKSIGYDKPETCGLCHGKMEYLGGGRYKCEFCGHEELDEFGKVKDFLETHGPTPSYQISLVTGVRKEVIDLFLKRGMVELPEESDYYLKCEKCGCNIRYGRYCPDCIQKLAGGIQALFSENAGEKPRPVFSDKSEKMRYL